MFSNLTGRTFGSNRIGSKNRDARLMCKTLISRLRQTVRSQLFTFLISLNHPFITKRTHYTQVTNSTDSLVCLLTIWTSWTGQNYPIVVASRIMYLLFQRLRLESNVSDIKRRAFVAITGIRRSIYIVDLKAWIIGVW